MVRKSTTRRTTRSDYFGVYALMEKVARGRDRVDVSKLDRNDNEEPEVTGGYMWKVDRLDPGDSGIRGIRDASNSIGWIYPKEKVNRVDVVTEQQEDYLVGYFNEFVAAVKADDFINPDTGKHYSEYIDIPSWLNEHILRGLSKDPDAFRLSTYLNKPRVGRSTTVRSGILIARWVRRMVVIAIRWAGMAAAIGGRIPGGGNWSGSPGDAATTMAIRTSCRPMWTAINHLRLDVMSVENMHAVVDSMAAEIGQEAADRNFARWTAVRPNGGQFTPTAERRTWMGEVLHLKGWLQARVEWCGYRICGSSRLSVRLVASWPMAFN